MNPIKHYRWGKGSAVTAATVAAVVAVAAAEHPKILHAAPIGIDLVGIHAGGGSDGNFTAALGVPTLDGLGVDGAGAHTLQEHIFVSSIQPRVDLFAALLAGTAPEDVAPKGPAR